MMWVAFDRGLRLADKRCLPCPNRAKWMEARDGLYEEVMEKGWRCSYRNFVFTTDRPMQGTTKKWDALSKATRIIQ
jgi:GH15 family glucan-1,4-alpha-glucosidase